MSYTAGDNLDAKVLFGNVSVLTPRETLFDLWAYVSCGMVQAGKYRDGVPGMYTVLRLYHVNLIIPRKLSKTSCVGLLKAFSLGGIETKHN